MKRCSERKPLGDYQMKELRGPWCKDGSCVFHDTCKASIKSLTFDPPCFVTAKYHGLYLQEYAEVAA